MPKIILPEEIKKIIIFRTDRIGEVLLSTVCIDALKQHFPKSRITFTTSDYAKDIVSGRNGVNDIFVLDTLTEGNFFSKLIKLVIYLKKNSFDLAVILNPHKMLHLGCFLAGIKYRLGYNKKWPFCLTHAMDNKKYESKKHESEYNLDLLKSIGIEAKPSPPYIAIPEADSDYIDRFLKRSGLDNGKPVISIHPGSSNPEKRWPYKNFVLLASRIKENLDCNIVFLGSNEDKGTISSIVSESKEGSLDLSGAFTIKQLAAFLKKSALFIGNDAGPMHIAAAMGTTIIALFGPASFLTRWRPLGNKHIVLCKDDITKITPDEVLEAVRLKL